jgi:hypothetical protein
MTEPSTAFAIVVLLGSQLGGCADDPRPASDLGPADLIVDGARDLQVELGHDGAPDAFLPLPGLGTLGGECGVLDDAEWSSTSPFLFRNVLDYGSAAFDPAKLSAGGQAILAVGNLNAGSLHSEICAYEVLYRCELAKLLETEKTVDYYDANGKRTDLLTEIDARKVGVSVTRAYHYPPTNPYTEAEAKVLLEKKLADLPLSQANAKPVDAWSRSILQIVAYNSQYADAVQSAWTQVSPAIKGDAIVILTVTDGEDGHVYP